MSSKPVIGWVGLGAMGAGMAASLSSQGFTVKAFDVWKPSLDAVAKAGVIPCTTPAETAVDAQVFSLMVVNAQQVEDVLFGSGGVAAVLPAGATIVCFSTVPPSFLATIQPRLDALGKDLGICDSPVSGGSSRAAEGTLTIMSSGTPAAISVARPMLDALSREPAGKLRVVGDTCGAASDFKLINQVLCTTQITMAGESLAFAANLGLNPRMVLDVIANASGNSFLFGHRGPWQLRDDGQLKSAMTICAKDAGIVMDEARLNHFPLPLCAATEQVMTMALGGGLAKVDDGRVSLMWEKFGGKSLIEQGTLEEELERAKQLDISASAAPAKVLVFGLGAMGNPMALAIQKAGIPVLGFDISLEAMDRYTSAGGKVFSDLSAEAAGADVVLLVPHTALQAEAILFGSADKSGLASALPNGAVIILSSTVAPSSIKRIQTLLDGIGRQQTIVDAPVAGGPSRAAEGNLTIMASGVESSLSRAAPVLAAMSSATGNAGNLHFIPGGIGSGSAMKLVNNHLAGVHLCAAAEALAFSKKKNMDLPTVLDVVSNGAAYSFVLVDRAPRMLQKNPPVHSALDTFVKDLGLALAEAKKLNTPLFLGAAAHQMFVQASAFGHGREDDSAISRLWEHAGVDIRS